MADLDAPIFIAPYDATWPRLFKSEQRLLEELLAPWLVGSIEHIGSTAVPGMPAKPIIDLMAAVGDLNGSQAAIPILETAGYCYAPYRPDEEHWFCKPKPSLRTHHLHLVPFKSRLWSETLIFRDYLRQEPVTAQKYIDLKVRLAQLYSADREAYTEGKKQFITSVVQGVSGR